MTNTEMVSYILVPILILLIRVADVSIGTLRIIFISRGIRYFAAILGFFEVLIWLFAISQIMQNLNSPIHYIAYAAGFGIGNFVGISIDRKLSLGNRTVRIITRKDATDLVRSLREQGYGVTSVDGEGVSGPVKLIFTIVRRHQAVQVIEIVRKFNPNAFFTVEDMRFVQENISDPLQVSARSIFHRIGGFIQKKK